MGLLISQALIVTAAGKELLILDAFSGPVIKTVRFQHRLKLKYLIDAPGGHRDIHDRLGADPGDGRAPHVLDICGGVSQDAPKGLDGCSRFPFPGGLMGIKGHRSPFQAEHNNTSLQNGNIGE